MAATSTPVLIEPKGAELESNSIELNSSGSFAAITHILDTLAPGRQGYVITADPFLAHDGLWAVGWG